MMPRHSHRTARPRRRRPGRGARRLGGRLREDGEVAARIAGGAGVTLNTNDAQEAARLDVADDAIEGLHRTLFRALVADWPHGVDAAVNVALLGRYYERFAGHAVAIAESVGVQRGRPKARGVDRMMCLPSRMTLAEAVAG